MGFESSDDAAVYRLEGDLCLIHTVDFFPPIVDDPYEFGQVAAANSLSDIYAMGGRPVSALNVFCIPGDMDHERVTKPLLLGGADKAAEAGINISGGHTLEDDEPKYGLSVVGVARESEILANGGTRPGDLLVLTKPLGSGILTTGDKVGLLSPEDHRDLVAVMAALNRWPAEQIKGLDVSACTDITGFGLVGHGAEMAAASGVTFEIYTSTLPVQENALEMARDGIIPGGAYKNRKFMAGRYQSDRHLDLALEDVCFDPQTSGGLLYSMRKEDALDFLSRCQNASLDAWIIGEAKERDVVDIKLLA